jgi:hypothetical protein
LQAGLLALSCVRCYVENHPLPSPLMAKKKPVTIKLTATGTTTGTLTTLASKPNRNAMIPIEEWAEIVGIRPRTAKLWAKLKKIKSQQRIVKETLIVTRPQARLFVRASTKKPA